MEKIRLFFKKINAEKIILPNRLYYVLLFGIPVIGVIVKNVLVQAYLQGINLYSPNFGKAIGSTWKYWIIYAGIVMIPLSVAFLFKRDKNRCIYIFIWNVIFTVLSSMDLIYSRSFFTMPSAADVYIFKNFSGFDGGEVTSLLSPYDAIMFIDIFVLGFFIFAFRRRKTDDAKRMSVLRKTAIVTVLAAIAIISIIPLQSKLFGIFNDVYEDMYKNSNADEQAKYLSSLGFHVKDIAELIGENTTDSMSDDEEKLVKEYYEWKNENLPDNEYAGIFEGKNVLFLQIESLESFVIGREIDGQEICPNINKLVNNGFIFNNIFEQVEGGNSSDADLMYATSRLPVLKGGTFFRYASECELNSLPRMLINRGYDFTYHQAIRGSFWNYEEGWKNMIGGTKFVGSESYDMSGDKIGFTLNDEDYIKQVLPYLKDLNKPYYAHVVLNSSHMPFKLADDLHLMMRIISSRCYLTSRI